MGLAGKKNLTKILSHKPGAAWYTDQSNTSFFSIFNSGPELKQQGLFLLLQQNLVRTHAMPETASVTLSEWVHICKGPVADNPAQCHVLSGNSQISVLFLLVGNIFFTQCF